MVAKKRKTLSKSKQSGSSRKPKNLDLRASRAGAVKGGDVSHSDFLIIKYVDKSTPVFYK